MKPFNLEEAKAGKPACTRDGKDVRILCFNAKGNCPITALVNTGGSEIPAQYTFNGRLYGGMYDSIYDLFMKSETKKSIGYKRYLWKNPKGDVFVSTLKEGETILFNGILKWLDTEWQYEEYEE